MTTPHASPPSDKSPNNRVPPRAKHSSTPSTIRLQRSAQQQQRPSATITTRQSPTPCFHSLTTPSPPCVSSPPPLTSAPLRRRRVPLHAQRNRISRSMDSRVELFRRLALELPGAAESSHMGHTDFRLNGRIFATLSAQEKRCGVVKLTPEQQESFVTEQPQSFSPVHGGWGRIGMTVVHLYGSLALTGIGHGTDRAILLGLLGEAPDTVDPAQIEARLAAIRSTGTLTLLGRKAIPFAEPESLPFHRDRMYPTPGITSHPNGMRFTAFDDSGALLAEEVFYSIGGGFIVSEAERTAEAQTNARTVPYPFRSAADLLATAKQHHLTIADLLLANEVALLKDPTISINRPVSATSSELLSAEDTIKASILTLWRTMQSCAQRGIEIEGILPGGLNVRRRAPRLARRLEAEGSKDPLAP